MARRVGTEWWLIGLFIGLVLGGAGGALAHRALVGVMSGSTANVIYEALPPYGPGQVGVSGSDRAEIDAFMRAQVAAIRSDLILAGVAARPDVLATSWAGALESEPAAGDLREIVGARVIPDTNLLRITVQTDHVEDAEAIARAVDEEFREVYERVTMRDAAALIEDVERKVRARRQEVAAMDARFEELQTRKRDVSVEESAEFEERAILVSRLAEVRADLVMLPPPNEASGDDMDARRALEDQEARLVERIEHLDGVIAEMRAPLEEVETLEANRAAAMDRIGSFERVIEALNVQLDGASRIRVLSPAAVVGTLKPPSQWMLVAASAVVLGALGLAPGLILSMVRSRGD